ncbi:RluA family pseudouridine synthase [soil metagenome]
MEIRNVTYLAAGQRLDVFLTGEFPEFSRSKIQKAIEQTGAVVNETLTHLAKLIVQEGDTISFELPVTRDLQPTDVAFDTIFEDDAILVINKPVGLIVHPTTLDGPVTLVHALLKRYPAIADAIYDEASDISHLRPGIVHRLDKDTSGVLVVAKTKQALTELARQFHEHETSKRYQVVLYGNLREVTTVDAPIHRKGGGRKNLMGASHTRGAGRDAESTFTPITVSSPYVKWPEEKVTLCSVAITTGRTHQIRVHAKFMGYPVLGDTLYTNKPALKLTTKLAVARQLLHAAELTITHPTTGEKMTFTAPLPVDMQPYATV